MRPVKRNRKLLIILLSVIFMAVLAFFTGRYFIYKKIRENLHERLVKLREEGVDIRFESFNINALSGKIELYQLKVRVGQDSLHPDIDTVVPYVLVKGVSILQFITKKNLSIRQIVLQQPTVAYKLQRRSDQNENRKIQLENISIDKITLSSILVNIKDSIRLDTLAILKGNIQVQDLGLERRQDSLVWKDADLVISNLDVQMPSGFYDAHVKSFHLALTDKTLDIDSLKIKPRYSRRVFLKKQGKEIDYMQALISKLHINGFRYSVYPKPNLTIKKVEAGFSLDVYRDKRMPDRKKKPTTLPVQFLQHLPIPIYIDSVDVNDSYVSYEEYPEKGDSSGRVFFDKLYVTIHPLHNIPSKGEEMNMKAYSKFMGAGDLNAHFIFPDDTTRPNKAWGSLKNFPMSKLNDMLGPAAKVRIESGIMNNLKFNFNYNLYRSDGKLELNYKNLHISSLRQNKNNEQAVSLVKTLLLNTFIVRKNLDEDASENDKTGTILFYRDPQRSIFNYWWKSLFSGLKSAYNLDKLPLPKKKNGVASKTDHKKKEKSKG
jgi:hypothetical protein